AADEPGSGRGLRGARRRHRGPARAAGGADRHGGAGRAAGSGGPGPHAARVGAGAGRGWRLIAREGVGEPLARAVQDLMRHGARARVFSSREYDASRMTTLLRSLDLLVTSRYHAAVLSMAATVPQVAVGHDLRLASLYEELGLADDLFVKGGASPEVFAAVEERVERLLADPAPVRVALRHGYQVHAA